MTFIYRYICLLVLAIPLSCLMPMVNTDVWYVQYLFFLMSFYVGIFFLLFSKVNKSLSFFYLWTVFSAIVVANQHPRALLCINQFSIAMLGVYFISLLDNRQVKILINFIVALFILQSIMVILQSFNLDPIFSKITEPESDDTVGLSGSHNQLGLFYAVSAPYILVTFPWMIMMSVYGIYAATTMSAMAGMVAGVLVSLPLFKMTHVKYIAIISIALNLIFIYFLKFEKNFNDIVVQERFTLWKHNIIGIEDEFMVTEKDVVLDTGQNVIVTGKVTAKKWLGYGLGNFTRISPFAQNTYRDKSTKHFYEHMHNDLLEVWFEMGRTGFIIIIICILNIIVLFFRSKKSPILIASFGSFLAHLVTSFGIYTVHTAVSGMMLVITLGLFFGEIRRQRDGAITVVV